MLHTYSIPVLCYPVVLAAIGRAIANQEHGVVELGTAAAVVHVEPTRIELELVAIGIYTHTVCV